VLQLKIELKQSTQLEQTQIVQIYHSKYINLIREFLISSVIREKSSYIPFFDKGTSDLVFFVFQLLMFEATVPFECLFSLFPGISFG
jgi:hypothetical protein